MALEERTRKPSDSAQHLVCHPRYFLKSSVLFPKGSPRSGRSRVLPAGWTAFHLVSDWRVGSEIRGLQLTAHSCESANVHLTHPSMKRLRKAKGVALGQTQRHCISVSRAVVCSQPGFACSSSYPQASGFYWFLFELFSCHIPSPLEYGAVFQFFSERSSQTFFYF